MENKKLFGTIIPATALVFGIMVILGAVRNGIPMALGSGIWGATFLAAFVGIAGVVIGIVLTLYGFNSLKKLWNKEQNIED